MPVYVYECKSCHYRFEVKQSISDEPFKTCPECQCEVRRVFFPVGIVFKGPGFYSTDNAKSGGATRPAEEPSTTPESAKPEAKKEPAAAAASATAGDKQTDV